MSLIWFYVKSSSLLPFLHSSEKHNFYLFLIIVIFFVHVTASLKFSYTSHVQKVPFSALMYFRSDLDKNYIQFIHFFPDKRLSGQYEINGNFLGTKINNKGSWNLALFDYIQTMTVSRKPRNDEYGRKVYDTPLKVSVNLQSCKNLELHISHLFGGRSIVGESELYTPYIIRFKCRNSLVKITFENLIEIHFHKNFELQNCACVPLTSECIIRQNMYLCIQYCGNKIWVLNIKHTKDVFHSIIFDYLLVIVITIASHCVCGFFKCVFMVLSTPSGSK